MSKWPSWLKLNWADHRMGFLRFLPKRFWAIVLIAGLLLAGLTLSTPSIIRHFQRQQLRSYVNQDLKALEESERDRFEHLIDALIPEATALHKMERDPQTWKEWIEKPFKSRKYRSPFGYGPGICGRFMTGRVRND